MEFAWSLEKEQDNIVKHGINFADAKELTFEEQEEARRRIEAASKRPYVYDPDCPLLTPEQLAEFRPVNYATMEERAQAMREAGIFNPEIVEQKAM